MYYFEHDFVNVSLGTRMYLFVILPIIPLCPLLLSVINY